MAKKQLSALAGEEALAQRVAYERQKRGWSTSKLARLVTETGCPINQSAVWKIENSTPRRKIAVDEAVAFAKVFKVPLDDLLEPVDAAVAAEFREVLGAVTAAVESIRDTTESLEGMFERLGDLVQRHPGLSEPEDEPDEEARSFAVHMLRYVDEWLAENAERAATLAGSRSLVETLYPPEKRGARRGKRRTKKG